MQSVSIVGAGRLGGALALALSRNGYLVENLVFRSCGIAERTAAAFSAPPKLIPSNELVELNTEIIIITTADPDIGRVKDALLTGSLTSPFVFHTSGSLSSDILSELKSVGCRIGSIHPLVSVSDPVRGAESFAGTYFCIEGEADALETAAKMVKSLGGMAFSVPSDLKPLYHASAVMAAGHIVALFDAAVEVASACGIENASNILLPLVQSTVSNLEAQNTTQALTGTFARTDVGAFERHLSLLQEKAPVSAVSVYLALAVRSLEIAERNGANSENVAAIREGISIAKKKLG